MILHIWLPISAVRSGDSVRFHITAVEQWVRRT
jgi:hypothetical protein